MAQSFDPFAEPAAQSASTPSLGAGFDPFSDGSVPETAATPQIDPFAGAQPAQWENPLASGLKAGLEGGVSAIQWLGQKLGAPQQGLYKGIQQVQQGGLEALDPSAMWEHAAGTFSGSAEPIMGEQLLGDAGMNPGFLRSVAGFGVDLAADPLNLLGVGAVRKGLQAAAAPLKPALQAAERAAMLNPTLTRPLQTVMAHVGPKEYRDLKTVHEAARQGQAHQVIEDVARAGVGIREDPFKTFEQLPQAVEHGITADTPQDVAQSAEQLAALLEAHKQRALVAGTLSEENLIKDIGYLPRVFEKEGTAPRIPLQASAAPEPKGFMMNPGNRQRQIASREDAAKVAGFVADPFESTAQRLVEGTKLAKDAEFIKGLAESSGKFGMVVEEGQAIPAGWRTLQGIRAEPGTPFASALRTYAFPEVIAGDLERMVARAPEYGDLGKMARMFNQGWKTWTTTANPAFHTTNFVGNAAQAVTLGEMNPLMVVPRLAEAAALLAGNGHTAQKTFGTLSGADAVRVAKQMGAVGADFGQFSKLTDNLADAFKSMGVKAAAAPGEAIKAGLRGKRLNPAEHYIEFMQRAGRASEDTWRLAKFLDDLAKGKTPEEATLGTIKTFFAYDQLSPDMKKIRDIAVPFVTWSAKNIPAKMKQFVTRPDLAMREVKAIRALQDPDEEVPLEAQPEFAKERGAITARFKTAKGQPVLLDPNLPVQDIEQLRKLLPPAASAALGLMPEGDAAAPGIGAQLLETLKSAAGVPGGMLSKPVAMPVELLLGKDLRSGNELWKDPRWIENPETGEALPTATRKAPWPVQALGALAPGAAEAIGAFEAASPTEGDVPRWEMPAMEAWALRSVLPGAFNTAGQAALSLSDVEDPTGGLAVGPSAAPNVPPWMMRILTGATAIPMTEEQLQRNAEYGQRDVREALRAALRAAARRVEKSQR